MAYTTPATWNVGESPTAAKMNQQIRDNIVALRTLTPAVSLYDGSTQSVADNTWTTMTFSAATVNVGGMFSGGAPTRITISVDGQYRLAAQVPFEACSNSVSLGARFLFNGATAYAQLKACGSAQNDNGASISQILDLVAGNYIELQAWQNSGSAKNVLSTVAGVNFTAERL